MFQAGDSPRLAEIRLKLERGAYDDPGVAEEIARRILKRGALAGQEQGMWIARPAVRGDKEEGSR